MNPGEHVERLYADVGAKLAGRLLCRHCLRARELSAAEAAQYLRVGFPLCCRQTMMIVPLKEELTTTRGDNAAD
jgi:hypothetical protein